MQFAERSDEANMAAAGGASLPSPTNTPNQTEPAQTQRLAYSLQEAADLLGVNYFSVYRLVQRGKLKVCRALRGKFLVPRTELLRLLKAD